MRLKRSTFPFTNTHLHIFSQDATARPGKRSLLCSIHLCNIPLSRKTSAICAWSCSLEPSLTWLGLCVYESPYSVQPIVYPKERYTRHLTSDKELHPSPRIPPLPACIISCCLIKAFFAWDLLTCCSSLNEVMMENNTSTSQSLEMLCTIQL